jgi:hypothetical protein
VSRPPSPRAARTVAVRWLTVALAVIGLGVLHGAHCADDVPVAAVALAAAHHDEPPTAADAAPSEEAAIPHAAAQGHHDDGQSPPCAMTGACLLLRTAVAGTGPVVADTLRPALHASSTDGVPPPSPSGRPLPRVPLAELGVLRI